MLRVLLIDKDQEEANRIVSELGADHSVLPANDFAEANEALSLQNFDAVVLAGSAEAAELSLFAAKLRELDGRQGRVQKTPLLSRSANVSSNPGWARTEDKVLDAYLANDFGPTALTEAVMSLARNVNHPAEQDVPILDENQFREQVGYDPELMVEIIDLFTEEREKEVPAMQIALRSGDFSKLAKLAHTIKGSLGSLHAPRGRARAQELETAAKAGDGPSCRTLLGLLEAELTTLEPRLQSLRDHPQEN